MATLVVHGRVAGKGSRTVGRRKDGGTYTRPASKYEKAWVEAVAESALAWRAEGGLVVDPPYRVELDFHFKRPKRPVCSWPTRVDIDKAVRATIDGCVRGGLLTDDRHATRLAASSCFTDGRECCVVRISQAA